MSKTLTTTLGFAANYDVERAGNPLPKDAREFRKPGGTPSGLALEVSTGDIVLEVRPASGESWVGRFHGGAEGLDGVFATPDPDVVCVIVRGQGYWVPVHEPMAFEAIRSTPIKNVLSDPRTLIFASFTRLSAYGQQGFMWVTEDLSWDGLKDLSITGPVVRGTAWDAPAGRGVPFLVDMVTGRTEGGSSPAKHEASST